ncbi:MAG: ParB/RepB/Spo0J family partition protein [Oscillospiraceae bacterium]|nr:ParB/RepB/Spo0J family partition protein [Oscillospiraceae bacterium]
MAKKTGLGGNFDSIFDDNYLSGTDDGGNKSTTTLKVGELEPNRNQPRKDFDNEKLGSLAESIAIHGIIQPITVRPFEGSYQIVAGERRWRAARMAGLSDVPVRIVELTDSETMQIALIENLQREDLNPLEEANGYQELIDKFGMKQEDVAKKVGKARSSVANALRLLSLPEAIKDMVKSGELSKGHCKALLGISDTIKMVQLAQKSIDNSLSVHALEKLIKSETAPKKDEPIYKKNPLYTEAELSLSNTLGKTVRIKEGQNNRVTVEIDAYSEDEVMDIVKRLGGFWD